MKKYIIIVLLFLITKTSFWYNDLDLFPKYYWTKKCESSSVWNNENSVYSFSDWKKYADYSDLERSNYYIFKWDLYKSWKIFKTWVDYLLLEKEWDIIYWIKNDNNKTDIYFNNNIILTTDSYVWNFIYDEYLNKYSFDVFDDSIRYVFSEWKLTLYGNYEYHKRTYSDNWKYFIDDYSYNPPSSRNPTLWFRLEKDWKIILQSDSDIIIDSLIVSNDNNYSIRWYDWNLNDDFYILNWGDINIWDMKKIVYSPSWKDLYYILEKDKNFIFYKNNNIIWEYYGLFSSFKFNFINDDNFYMILENSSGFALIKNDKTIIWFDSNIQIKYLWKKENWDIIVLKRNKELWIDTLIVNWKIILEADYIDERYLNSWIWTFSIYPNKLSWSEYYTYASNNWEHSFLVDGYEIPNMYDYLRLINWLTFFKFSSYDYWDVYCQDITYTYPDLKLNREELMDILDNVSKLNNKNKIALKSILEKYKKSIKKESNIELINMIIDNLNLN